MSEQQTLYLAYLRDPATPLNEEEFKGTRRLDDGLYLIRSALSRSKVYHAVKRATGPDVLLVAPLADDPKFKGMDEGALKWLRSSD